MSQYDPAFFRDTSPEPEKSSFVYLKLRCSHNADVGRLLSASEKILAFIYDTNLRTKKVRAVPIDLRDGIHQSSAAALLSAYARCNRPKVRPARHARIFGNSIKADLDRGVLLLVKENIVLPCPAEIRDHDILKISFLIVYDNELELLVKVKATPFNIADIPDAAFTSDYELTADDFPNIPPPHPTPEPAPTLKKKRKKS